MSTSNVYRQRQSALRKRYGSVTYRIVSAIEREKDPYQAAGKSVKPTSVNTTIGNYTRGIYDEYLPLFN